LLRGKDRLQFGVEENAPCGRFTYY